MPKRASTFVSGTTCQCRALENGARLVRDAAPVCSHLDVRGRESHSIPIAIAPHTSSILTICIFILGVGPHTEILAEEAREYSNIA